MQLSDSVQAQNNTGSRPVYPALNRLGDQLEDAGMDSTSVNFILGRMARAVADSVMSEIARMLRPEELKAMETMDEAERERKLDSLFLENKGQSVTDYGSALAEQLVGEFEKLD